MAEEKGSAPAEEEIPAEGEGGDVAPDEGADKEADDTDVEGAGDDTDKDEDIDIEPDAIPVRSSASHIIARQNRTIEKLRAKKEAPSDDGDDDDSDDDLKPTDDNSGLQQQVDILTNTVVGQADENELKGLLKDEPGAAKYEKRIRSYMKDSHYKGVPPSVIYHHLAFNAAQGMRAKKKEVADVEANQMKGGGSSRKGAAPKTGKIPSIEEQENMSEKEYEQLTHDINTGKYSPSE